MFFTVMFVLGINPVPSGVVRAATPDINLWFKDHVHDRLARMYGGADKVPPIAGRIRRGQLYEPPPFQGKPIIRGAMLYFLPGEMQKKADGIWTRWARVMDDLIGTKTASASVAPADDPPQAARRHLAPSPASRGLWSAAAGVQTGDMGNNRSETWVTLFHG